MKTTIDLPDALAEEARAVARESGTTLRELVVDGLRTALEQRRQGAEPVPFTFVTTGGRGLQAGADPHRWTELGYDLP